jgi:mRNA-degrading endonuclease RelE of RelBE toxin-antitoxin system
MSWTIKRTDTFLESLSRIKGNKEAIAELGKKLNRLKEDPLHTGGWLSGALHGKKATRVAKRYRLIFLPVEKEQVVYLIGIDHRGNVYE